MRRAWLMGWLVLSAFVSGLDAGHGDYVFMLLALSAVVIFCTLLWADS